MAVAIGGDHAEVAWAGSLADAEVAVSRDSFQSSVCVYCTKIPDSHDYWER